MGKCYRGNIAKQPLALGYTFDSNYAEKVKSNITTTLKKSPKVINRNIV